MNKTTATVYSLLLTPWLSVSIAVAMDDSEIFSLDLHQLLGAEVSVASNVTSSYIEQPVSTSIIDRRRIETSGARTLNELLTLFVPGFFTIEDQDDTISGFRGIAADNNSKVLLLLNGHSLNTEWFFGPPDAVINGLDLNYIERLEVIRGPGSVTLGQGALLGVINVITFKDKDAENEINVSYGENDFSQQSLFLNYQKDELSLQGYLAKTDFDSEPNVNEGWTRGRVDQGLSVFERQHHLKRGDNINGLLMLQSSRWKVTGFHFQQKRDLHNFFRDREVIEQRLDGISLSYTKPLANDNSIHIHSNFQRDDYALFSHGNNIETQERLDYESDGSEFSAIYPQLGIIPDAIVEPDIVMGGTREERRGAKIIVNLNSLFTNNRFAIGAEYTHFDSGQENYNGDNFIINDTIQRFGINADNDGNLIFGDDLNVINTWAKPEITEIKSVFIEDFYSINKQWDVFAGLRYDDHPNWGSHISPRLGLLFALNEKHFFRASWQTGFRGAVGVVFSGGFVQDGLLAQENFGLINSQADTEVDFDFDGDATNDSGQLNPLEPETIESFELAWNYIASESRHIKTTFFYNTFDDILAASALSYQNLRFGDRLGSDALGTWNGNWFYQNEQESINLWGLEVEFHQLWKYGEIDFSHALVQLSESIDDDNIYVVEGDNLNAYPDNVSRLHSSVQLKNAISLHYHHLYYWNFYSSTNEKQQGEHIANLTVLYETPVSGLSARFVIKNLWNQTGLYPFASTGDATGSEGSPSLEKRVWWAGINYQF